MWTPSAQTPAPPAQTAPAQAPGAAPAEDPERVRLEARLKELQRRELNEPDLTAQAQLLRSIIDLCIELGCDYASYRPKLAEVEERLAKETEKESKAERERRALAGAKDRARLAMRSVPPNWKEAKRMLDFAAHLGPADPEVLRDRLIVQRQLRGILIYRVVLGTLALAAVAGLVVAVRPLLKGRKAGGPVRRLELLAGTEPPETFQLENEITTLGAGGAEADWVIADPSRRLSRRHCDISRSGRHYFLTDHSSNGTSINGRRVPKGEPVLLRKGDRISLAEGILLRFR